MIVSDDDTGIFLILAISLDAIRGKLLVKARILSKRQSSGCSYCRTLYSPAAARYSHPRQEYRVTIDEELGLLEDNLRRLKIEYEVYFSGGSKKPPTDIDWRVRRVMKKYSDGRRMSYTQRFRFNTLANRYAVYNDLWRQKLKIKDEGYRRPQDAILSIAGMRAEQEHEAAEILDPRHHVPGHAGPFSVRFTDPEHEPDKIQALFEAMLEARKRAGASGNSNFDSFCSFVRQKTQQIRHEHGCKAVEYTIEARDGQVRLKAKGKRQ